MEQVVDLATRKTGLIGVALVCALTVTAWAALGKNSVGSKQLKKNAVVTAKIKKEAVTGAKVKKDTLTGTQINEGTLGAVPLAKRPRRRRKARPSPCRSPSPLP